jgi:hypothetical protein
MEVPSCKTLAAMEWPCVAPNWGAASSRRCIMEQIRADGLAVPPDRSTLMVRSAPPFDKGLIGESDKSMHTEVSGSQI